MLFCVLFNICFILHEKVIKTSFRLGFLHLLGLQIYRYIEYTGKNIPVMNILVIYSQFYL